MDSGLIGFIGVIAGALTTGGAQLIVEERKRRNDALSAARLVYGALAEAEAMISYATETGSWGSRTGRTLFEPHIAVWHAQRESLARVVGTLDFHSIGSAFNDLSHMDDVISRAFGVMVPDRGVSQVLADPEHGNRMLNLNQAEKAAYRAGRTVSDRVFYLRDKKRLRTLLAGPRQIAAVASESEGDDGNTS